MADGTKIEWTDSTWTPVKGCTRVSPGCGGPGRQGGCYAEIMAARFSKPGQWGEGLAEIVTLPDGSKDHRWTGVVRFDERELLKPLSWKKPRRIFVCSTADLFHEKVTDEQIDRVFAVMALCPQHTFQVLTKRPERMATYVTALVSGERSIWAAARSLNIVATPIAKLCSELGWGRFTSCRRKPLPNLWLGTSVEDQARANERIPHLLATPAAVRFLSCEPLLGAIDLRHLRRYSGKPVIDGLRGLVTRGDYLARSPNECSFNTRTRVIPPELPSLDWIIVGGESGHGARPMHPDWARSLRDQCAAAGVPFFFKQIGEWGWPAVEQHHEDYAAACNGEGPWRGDKLMEADGTILPGTSLQIGSRIYIRKVGKKAAGRLLDGVQHDGMPEAAHA